MKQLFVVLAVVGVLGATEARAQDRGGFRIGLNAANISGNDSSDLEDTKVRTGLVVGLFGVVPVNAHFAFQPEVLFSQQGAKIEEGSDKATLKLDYIQIPLLARIRLGMNPSSPIHALVGPAIGFRTKGEIEFDGDTQELEDDEVEKTDFGLVTGIAINAGMAVIDVRETWGLRNIDKSGDGSKVKNRVFSASVGIRF